jgi:hypothetical protein
MSEHKDPVYVRLGADDGQVLLLFTKDPEGTKPANISQWRIDHDECVEIARAMAHAAFEVETGTQPVGDALLPSLIEQHRMKLTQRFSLMLATMRQDKVMTNGQIAQRLVDAALQEVF